MNLFEKIIELENRIKNEENKTLMLNNNDKRLINKTRYAVNKLPYNKLSQEYIMNNKLEQLEIK